MDIFILLLYSETGLIEFMDRRKPKPKSDTSKRKKDDAKIGSHQHQGLRQTVSVMQGLCKAMIPRDRAQKTKWSIMMCLKM